jgi:hypothetical protein
VQLCEIRFIKISENPVEYNNGPQAIAIADFNEDGQLDLVILNRITVNIQIYIGYGDGTFESRDKYSNGPNSAPRMIAVGDFNHDHHQDIAVANYGTNSIGIFLGFGNGTFERQNELSTGSSRPNSIGLADLNNDTNLDMVIVNYGTNSVSIYYGHGDGPFLYPQIYSTGLRFSSNCTGCGRFQ